MSKTFENQVHDASRTELNQWFYIYDLLEKYRKQDGDADGVLTYQNAKNILREEFERRRSNHE